MEKCKFCQQELEADSTVCPHCGKDNAQTADAVTEEMEQPQQPQETQEQQPQEAQEQMPQEEGRSVEAEPVPETMEELPVTHPEEPEKKKATPGKIALAVAAVVVLAAVLIALIVAGMQQKAPAQTPETTDGQTQATSAPTTPPTIPADGNPDDVTCQGSYTVTDQEAQDLRQTVVATVGEDQLTNGLLQVYYWSGVNSFLNSQQGYYLMAYGAFDPSQPLDTQKCAVDENLTWQQHFLQTALTNWHTSCAMAAEAKKAGIEMGQQEKEFLENMEQQLTQTAEGYGMTLEELLAKNIGPGAGFEEFQQFQANYSRGSGFYNQEIAKLVPTQEDLEAFYQEHEADYTAGGITKDSKFVNVRHILLSVQGTTDEEGNTVSSEADWDSCEKEAQAVLDQWLAGDKTEESFAALANEKSTDAGSNTSGGLYENVFEGQMVKPFEDWCFDASRKPGDTGLVRSDFGYHVMYFVNSTPQWQQFAQQDWVLEKTNQFIETVTARYPMEVNYDAMALGYLPIGQ